jgi:hypothetical protein
MRGSGFTALREKNIIKQIDDKKTEKLLLSMIFHRRVKLY